MSGFAGFCADTKEVGIEDGVIQERSIFKMEITGMRIRQKNKPSHEISVEEREWGSKILKHIWFGCGNVHTSEE